jgi:hypothetical protein
MLYINICFTLNYVKEVRNVKKRQKSVCKQDLIPPLSTSECSACLPTSSHPRVDCLYFNLTCTCWW